MNSFVKFLKGLGYYTVGMCTTSASTYNRIKAYVDLGFYDTYFIDDMTVEIENIRWFVSDEFCYKQLIELYKYNETNIPQFLYCLTIKNHASFEMGILLM